MTPRQPYYDQEIAKIIEWCKKHGYTFHVSLNGEVELRKKNDQKTPRVDRKDT